jgi:hypothetical protein
MVKRFLKMVRAGPVTSTQKLLRALVIVIVLTSIALVGWLGANRVRQTENTIKLGNP